MSKIAEQKALEEYPLPKENSSSFINQETFNSAKRTGYIKGYDQAMQDIKEFIYDKFNIHLHDCHVVQYDSDTPLESMDDFIEQFDWQSFRAEAAKDILCATLSGGTASGMIGIVPEKETIVKVSIEIANELIKQLKEKEEI